MLVHSMRLLLTGLIVLASVSTGSSTTRTSTDGSSRFPVLEGDYLGQKPPGIIPEIFAPGIISTKLDELNALFSPDGTEFYFSIKMPGMILHTMLVTKVENGKWTEPAVLPFSGRYSDADPAFSADGEKMFFISRRPAPGSGGEEGNWHIWVVERKGSGWGDPQYLEAPVNSDQMEVYPSLTADGALYFSSTREGGMGRGDIYCSRLLDGRYAEVENLGEPINSEHSEGDIYIAPDESYIIFTSSRPDGLGRGDLYISFARNDGSWTVPDNMGYSINTAYTEYCPRVTPDGRYLFFTTYKKSYNVPMENPLDYEDMFEMFDSIENGLGNLYWVNIKVIECFRPAGE